MTESSHNRPKASASGPGGTSIADALTRLEEQGFSGGFGVLPEARLHCLTCDARVDASDVVVHGTIRIEGISDPEEMAAVAGLECPRCHARGTCVFSYGPMASGEDQRVFVSLRNVRDEP